MPTPRVDVVTIAATTRDARVTEPLSLLNDMQWANGVDPSCTSDPDAFYPEQGGRQHASAAKAVCAACPIRVACLEHAIDNDESWGIWGGLTTAERRRLKRDRSAVDDGSSVAA